MRKLDALLVSMAVGLSIFTAGLFASDYPMEADAVEQPRSPSKFEAVLLHGTRLPHEKVGKEEAVHVVIGPAGARFTRFWDTMVAVPHTGRPEVNDRALSVVLTDDVEGELALRFLTNFCREYGIPAHRIYSHEELEPEKVCPGPRVNMPALRREIERRLAEL